MTRSDIEVIAHKEAVITFLRLAASGNVREAFDNYVGESSGIIIPSSPAMRKH
jgi:hypothetical protein